MVEGLGNYHDFSTLQQLRRDASANPEDSIEPVARQFESVFIQMVLKSMRETVPDGGLLDNEQLGFYREMLDNQLAVDMAAGKGIGLAETIAKQLRPPTGDTTPESQALKAGLLRQQGEND